MYEIFDKISVTATSVMALSSASVHSTHQYGYDMTIRVQNMSKVYPDGCTKDMYAKFLSDVAYKRAVEQDNIAPQRHHNYSLEVLQKRRILDETDIMFRITFSDGVEVENPASTFTQCQLLLEQKPDPQLTPQNGWMNTTVYMMPNSTHDFGYLHQERKYDRYTTVFVSPPDTVTHLQFVFMNVQCNDTDQEVVVYVSKKNYKLCRPVEVPSSPLPVPPTAGLTNNTHDVIVRKYERYINKANLSEICGQPFSEWPVNRNRFRIIGGEVTPIRSQPWTVYITSQGGGYISSCSAAIIDHFWIVTAGHCIIRNGTAFVYNAYNNVKSRKTYAVEKQVEIMLVRYVIFTCQSRTAAIGMIISGTLVQVFVPESILVRPPRATVEVRWNALRKTESIVLLD
ncbi:unnamed protein product [Soboliphyme baturini]|uniref:Peptidase S1 domain-containing protein n=1 Tax=Soboliphyme baturini TaxID=241478 RepID=A0A183IWW0_9BILA|nr:unnamed protein product [Soboliphyme baturini]